MPRRPRRSRAGPLCRLLALALALALARAEPPPAPPACSPAVVRSIAWGAGIGAHQAEGAAAAIAGARAPSVWEAYIAKNLGAIADGSSAAAGADFAARFKSDVALLKSLGVKHFRLSLSWPRLLPGARAGSAPSAKAVAFYNDLLDELLAAGIQPMVALYHWDLPQALQEAYGGFAGPQIADDFAHFADTAFRLFGAKVKTWLTFIEPAVVCNQQYGNGQFAPGAALGDAGRCACARNLLLAHAAAAKLYRERYRAAQGGRLGFTTLVTWAEPADPGSRADALAARNKLDAEVGWFLDPVFSGDWPRSLKAAKGAALPPFSPSEAALLKGSVDFLAVNVFTGKYVWAAGDGSEAARGAWREGVAHPTNGSRVGPASGVSWIAVAPWTQRRALRYLKERYGALPVVVSSSGVMGPGEARQTAAQQLDDSFRLDYYRQYLDELCRAVRDDGANVVAWFAWSFLDLWEWREGYTTKFGIVRVDYADGSLARAPKASARWLAAHFFGQGAPRIA